MCAHLPPLPPLSKTLELKHPNNPKLKPAEVLPIFPDYSLWSNDYVLLSFNKMPAHEKGVFVDVNPIAEDSGVLNSMDIDQAEQLKTSRVLCKRKARDDENDEDEDEGVGQAGDFAVASKYKVLRKTNPDNYIFALRAEVRTFAHLKLSLTLVQSTRLLCSTSSAQRSSA